MAVTVLVPTALQKFTNNQATLECTGSNISELFESLEAACPGIKSRLCDDEGKPRRFLNIYVNSKDIRFLQNTETPLHDGDEVSISIVPTIKVLIPTALQKFTNEQATLECSGSNISELFESLEAQCPGIKSRLCDDEGKPRRFLNLYVNSEDIRFLDGTGTALKDGDEVSIVPAVAGG